MEAQSFGVPLGFGGPYCGVIATREKFVRQMPGRLVGRPSTSNGKRGFVLTLATREQHIRREKATSNICTNQALVALMVNIFMTVYGKVGCGTGQAEPGQDGYAAASSANTPKCCSRRAALQRVRGRDQRRSLRHQLALLGHKIVGGLPLKKFYPELGNAALWCCTE
jgi:glycine dehydrogenase subunit 1